MCGICEFTRPHKHVPWLWFATSWETVVVCCMTSTWDLGGKDKYLWLNLEMFFPFIATCPPCIQEKITFTGIDFQHLLVLKTRWNQLFHSKVNFMWQRQIIHTMV